MNSDVESFQELLYLVFRVLLPYPLFVGLILIFTGIVILIKTKHKKGRVLIDTGIISILISLSVFLSWGSSVLYENATGECLGFSCSLQVSEEQIPFYVLKAKVVFFSLIFGLFLTNMVTTYVAVKIGNYLMTITKHMRVHRVIRIALIYPLIFTALFLILNGSVIYAVSYFIYYL